MPWVWGLGPGSRLQASIDPQGRLVLVPSKDEPEDLFRDRPPVRRTLSLDDMERAIAAATGHQTCDRTHHGWIVADAGTCNEPL